MKSINLAAIDLNLLVAFEALIELHSVTKAAEQLQIGQPAMSASLQRLRVLFEDELFVRLGRQMQPTLKAQAIAPSILAALHQVRQAVELSQTFNSLVSDRDFAIGSSDYTSLVLLPSLLAFSHKNAPNLNYRMIGFEKDGVGKLLEQGAIDVALGVFSDPPRQTLSEPLFTEHFVGIVRHDHPDLVQGTIDLESFAKLPHALFTLRRDAIGEIDRILAEHNLERRIALTTPHLLVLPSAISKSNLVATVPYRIALHLASICNLSIFELPINTKPWMVSMLWSTLSDRDEANCWLRQTIKTMCQQIN
jgi:DNA-binding transcriptional LysR family regulator